VWVRSFSSRAPLSPLSLFLHLSLTLLGKELLNWPPSRCHSLSRPSAPEVPPTFFFFQPGVIFPQSTFFSQWGSCFIWGPLPLSFFQPPVRFFSLEVFFHYDRIQSPPFYIRAFLTVLLALSSFRPRVFPTSPPFKRIFQFFSRESSFFWTLHRRIDVPAVKPFLTLFHSDLTVTPSILISWLSVGQTPSLVLLASFPLPDIIKLENIVYLSFHPLPLSPPLNFFLFFAPRSIFFSDLFLL